MKLRILGLGGLGEIGKNMYVLEMGDKILVIDCGVKFPDERTPGVDLLLPDFSYLVSHKDKVVGLLLTHGHEDHVGAIPYFLEQVPCPVYGSDITLGLAGQRVKELGIPWKTYPVKAGDKVSLKGFQVEFLQITHSVPGCLALVIRTKLGNIFFTGDFKFDQTPIDGRRIDLARIAEISKEGILCLLCDSTNSERPGYAPSEQKVSHALEEIFRSTKARLIITTFASNVHRIQQIITMADRFQRKVAVDGMSMARVISVAQEMGYLKIPKGLLIKVEEVDAYPRDKLVIITTGSQGEPLAALSRIATGEHKRIKLMPGDTVVFSADPIPGNETLVSETVDNLYRQKAEVIYGPSSEAHVSGHGFSEDIKLMINLTRPRFFVPVHGEYRHLVKSARLAQEMGIRPNEIFLLENGDILSFTGGKAYVEGRIPTSANYVDGLSLDDVKSVVLRDRQQMAQEGVVSLSVAVNLRRRSILGEPNFIFKGFLEQRALSLYKGELREQALMLLNKYIKEDLEEESLEQKIKEGLQRYLMKKLKRRPLVIVNLLVVNGQADKA